MPGESKCRDPVELANNFFNEMNRRDLDAVMALHLDDAVWDASSTGAGTFEGAAAVRGFLKDWQASFVRWEGTPQELVNLGNGVVFALVQWSGDPAGSGGSLEARGALVFVLSAGAIERVTVHTRTGIDEARAAAQRLAASR
jgi:ketosteroid isomerase-like protein